MACPSCRGTDRIEIAPGYYQCTSTIRELAGKPGVVNPFTAPGGVVELVRRCVVAYQEEPPRPVPACRCGTYSVGQCTTCGRPVCGPHSSMFHGVRLCDEDLTAARNREAPLLAAAEAQAAERSRSKQAAAHEQWRARALASLVADGPTERTVRVVAAFCPADSHRNRKGWSTAAAADLLGREPSCPASPTVLCTPGGRSR